MTVVDALERALRELQADEEQAQESALRSRSAADSWERELSARRKIRTEFQAIVARIKSEVTSG
jgi:hypothetical protein